MKKNIILFCVFILLQISIVAQTEGIDSLLFQKLTYELKETNDEVILDLDIENELKNDIPKLKSILHFILKNENHLLELSSHTSCVGNLMVNLKTSETRVEIIKNEIYNLADSSTFSLLEKNLTTVGHGEFYPLIKCECTDCEEEKHQLNDRVTIKLTRILSSNFSKPITRKFVPALKGRGGRGPSFDPTSQVEGKISIKVCVDKNGIVIKSKTAYAPDKSTINDPKIIKQSIETANKWKFKPSAEEIACGTITYVIKIK